MILPICPMAWMETIGVPLETKMCFRRESLLVVGFRERARTLPVGVPVKTIDSVLVESFEIARDLILIGVEEIESFKLKSATNSTIERYLESAMG